MKKSIYILLVISIMLIVSCNNFSKSEIVMYYTDSIPKLEYFYKYYGNKEYVAEEIRYYPSGSVMTKGKRNENGEKHGEWITYHENGKKWKLEEYLHNKKDGDVVEWYKSGTKMYEGHYKNGVPDGEWVIYNENGDKINQE